MTGADRERRQATEEEIREAGIRLYVRCEDGAERALDWDHRFLTSEAVAARKAFPGVTPQRMLAAWGPLGALEDPEAIRAAVWMVRRFRAGAHDLKPQHVDVDLLDIRDEFIDANGVELDPPQLDLDQDKVDAAAAALLEALPLLPPAAVERLARLAVAALPPDEAEGSAGEGDAGDAPAPAPSSE